MVTAFTTQVQHTQGLPDKLTLGPLGDGRGNTAYRTERKNLYFEARPAQLVLRAC